MDLGLAQALRLSASGRSEQPAPATVAFVGAGGKSTAMFRLARELPSPVILTTTTHLGASQAALADSHLVAESVADLSGLPGRGVALVTGPAASVETARDRWSAPVPDVLSRLYEICAAHGVSLLIEADGAHRKPLKAPAAHEPSIPSFVGLVVVVAGLSGLEKALSGETVHRPDQFAALSGLRIGDPITPEALTRVLLDRAGGLKNIPRGARRVALLNQAGTAELQARARGMLPALLEAFDAVLIADMESGIVHAVHERVVGIVLAAGSASRFGRPKVLLDWHGEPFVRAVARTGLSAGLDPVIVITGSDADEVAAALHGLPVSVVLNDEWQSGQASSVRRGIRGLPASAGGAVFLLADQPQIRFDVITALMDRHAAGLYPIIAPLVMEERRANPVLFDRVTFPDLLALRGDVGGRAVFSRHRVEYMPWHDERLLLDVDTEEDYRRLLEEDTP